MKINGGPVTLVAPATNPNAGILLFQDRKNTIDLSVAGQAGVALTGAIYAQNAGMSYAGGSSGTADYTVFVLQTVNFKGGGDYHVNANYGGLAGGSPIKFVTLGE